MRQNLKSNNNKNSNKPLSQILGEFWSSTSLHGLPRVFTAENFILKGVWAVVFCVALGLLCWNTNQLLTKYFSYPAKVRLVLKSADKQIFPAVTVCNLNPVSKSKLVCLNQELATMDEYMTSEIEKFHSKSV